MMSMTNRDDLKAAFIYFAEVFDVPKQYRSKFENLLWKNLNDKRKALKEAEVLFPYNWESEFAKQTLIDRQEKFPYLKEQLELIVFKILRLANVNRQFRNAERVASTMPYLKIERGPQSVDCPVHSKHHGKIIPLKDDFWSDYPVAKHVDCYCQIRSISN
ncbi:hypothetical protein [Vibrio parahaemolyticus]|uniref:hypothetical protein n=1 Tax=Vibrio parahaemolyticus TaxID=670 RepID=UPI001112CBDD|nr:hypothetical protein [Vibrio parahaemolyticus]MDF4276339.1 hypothetical protein [Vibrio parahaemolyticus]MDF5112247.1 hypothetical protein [Vibrio parahaemolyticus]MDF5127105.1 hypothetical protein [Vibrio parahaemolyticus]MDF5487562.1 hypothetical protein [Vibrio parahaemolyticus]MDF5545626.1 hypothetical protein [Vibrio parahaemolyticus]